MGDEEMLAGHAGLDGEVTITRDQAGIPTIDAGSIDDAWWGTGYAAACDRLWQLEYDRRRATGRWSEASGPTGLPADRLARRLDLEAASRRDVAAMDTATATAFAAYAAGVNHGATSRPLPPEYALTGLDFEPWETWHSVAGFKIRHLLMGVWQYKLLRARLLADEGPDAFSHLDPVPREGMRHTVPTGSRHRRDDPAPTNTGDPGDADLWAASYGDLVAAASELGFLSEVEAGSNAWVVAGSKTTTGMPVLANDSHRAVDVPSVYWQATVHCPEFRVSGATFPGIPGFPHFGHTDHVGWAITNAAADAQDLLVETFREEGDGLQSRTVDGWADAVESDEEIRVRRPDGGHDTVRTRVTRTVDGPVLHGDPRTGRAVVLRWTATDSTCEQFGVLADMLMARTVTELLDAHAPWVDPVNNLLAADTTGSIGYLLRGALPRRRDEAAAQMPVPAWHPDSAWDGRVPFDAMPREEDPDAGWIANANNTVTGPQDGLLVTHSVNDFLRIERIGELLDTDRAWSPADLADMQNDRVSIAARWWSEHLTDSGPYEGAAEEARLLLADWDGDLAADGPRALLYAHLRRAVVARSLTRVVSANTAQRLLSAELPASLVLLKRWSAQIAWDIHTTRQLPAPMDDALVAAALSDAHAACVLLAGEDTAGWDWSAVHVLAPRHTLAGTDLEGILRDPVPVHVRGDADTIQNAAYPLTPGAAFPVTNTSVYRQVLDLHDLDQSTWVIPGGSSADPGSAHYDDQMATWGAGELLPMHTTRPAKTSTCPTNASGDGPAEHATLMSPTTGPRVARKSEVEDDA